MQGTLFQSAQRIIAQVLEWLQTTTNTSIAERVSDTFQNGVCANDLNSMAIIGKDTDSTLLDFFHVEVQTGIAYVSGERVALLDFPLITYNAANPLNTTFDGISLNVPTPQSTGSYNIPLTAGFVNYLFIGYLGTIDTTAFTLNDITLAKQFYKQTDGYQIVVNTTGINPNTAVYILLGQVNLSGANQAVSSNISIVARPYYVSLLNRIGIQTNNSGRTDRPSTYAIGSNNYFLDDHIKSIGTGTVSPLNAHGISLVDLGINPNDTVEFHREHEHVRGIIAGTAANPDPQDSAFFAQRVQVTPGDDFIIVQALGTDEVAVLNGIAYTSAQFGVNFTIPFTGNPVGVYNIYFDGTTFGITQTDITNDDTKLWLATTTWTPTPGDGNLTLPADRRQFGTLNLLERWVTAGRPQDPQAGNFGFNFDFNAMEYYDGTTWLQPITSFSTIGFVPTGAMLDFAGGSAPTSYLLCNGSAVSRTTFATLFGVIGTTWGVGDGSTTFNLPDFRRRVAVGSGGTGTGTLGNALANTGGAEDITLSLSQIPPHNHGVNDPGHSHSQNTSGGGSFGTTVSSGTSDGGTPTPSIANTNFAGTGISTQNAGSGASHSNIQPSAVVTKIIKI